VPVPSGIRERRSTDSQVNLRLSVNFAYRKQLPDYDFVPVLCGPRERRSTILIPRVDVNSVLGRPYLDLAELSPYLHSATASLHAAVQPVAFLPSPSAISILLVRFLRREDHIYSQGMFADDVAQRDLESLECANRQGTDWMENSLYEPIIMAARKLNLSECSSATKHAQRLRHR